MNEHERRHVNDAMVGLANGDRSAFDAVFGGLWAPLSDYVRRALNSNPDAEDVVQQTLLKVFARISEFDTSRDGVSWAFGIATNEIRTSRKKVQRRREALIDDVVIATDATSRVPTRQREQSWRRAARSPT
ncbi:MAG: sigma factor [Acidobacteriota bacterium]|nr:sigma factor [Acidobacteriota bacterium]